MTAPDPVREALVEAGKAVRLRARFSPLTGQALSEDFAAHAITAFLRALPPRFPLPRPGGQTWGHAHGEMARLATAVERASKEPPHA